MARRGRRYALQVGGGKDLVGLQHAVRGAQRQHGAGLGWGVRIKAVHPVARDAVVKSALGVEREIEGGCLHGRMKANQKNQIMEAFAKNEIQVLVSTTVIEVGVNVPNATVMMVENAERFGLSQLHQLRGRVGRGEHQSYCIFIQGGEEEETKKRLEILEKSNDGFQIAGEDLRLRGPGDFFGVRQSGTMEFRLADIFQDAEILKQAGEAAGAILLSDPDLSLEQHYRLKERLLAYGKERIEMPGI